MTVIGSGTEISDPVSDDVDADIFHDVSGVYNDDIALYKLY